MKTMYFDTPVDALIPVLVVLLIAVVILGPIIWVLASTRSHGGAKFGWFIVVFLFSWLGLAIFLIVTQALEKGPKRPSSIFKTTLLVSTVLFLLSLLLFLATESVYFPGVRPSLWMALGYKSLQILTWPMNSLGWPIWSWPLINFTQGLILALLFKLSMKIRTRKIAA